ncbi:hypothetical protein B9Z55_028262 [Caenorhabditis nigoni]|uniref:Uncharacterized protein n=1 Tax=Caenorhabditis nigoni TaxID=1611254 RepID=A0A2G5SCY1_9PELO|nr:hypothetical protein B9Z55_028259 [Caenorhabditis nigoni]PIC12756.1 hypothetical protein B9Z55_028262 [Caenorhabditis nigoni]
MSTVDFRFAHTRTIFNSSVMSTMSKINVPKYGADDEVTKLLELFENTLESFKYDVSELFNVFNVQLNYFQKPCRVIRVLRKNNQSLVQANVLFKENGRTKANEILLEMPKSIVSTKTGKHAFSNYIVALMKSNNPFNKENTLVSTSIKAGVHPGRLGTRFQPIEDITNLDVIRCVEPPDCRLNTRSLRATVTFIYFNSQIFS